MRRSFWKNCAAFSRILRREKIRSSDFWDAETAQIWKKTTRSRLLNVAKSVALRRKMYCLRRFFTAAKSCATVSCRFWLNWICALFTATSRAFSAFCTLLLWDVCRCICWGWGRENCARAEDAQSNRLFHEFSFCSCGESTFWFFFIFLIYSKLLNANDTCFEAVSMSWGWPISSLNSVIPNSCLPPAWRQGRSGRCFGIFALYTE